ncbi:B2 protein [Morella rubra]|uniref:B2 protein n=1 Tax=Morella rubra TaxID=262757 RepID=A0A6A1URD1_9ROSI|nr:B2 protein [Morella rubra]
MEQEKNKEAETPGETSAQVDPNMKEREDNKKKSDTPVEACTKPHSYNKEAEASTGAESSRKKTPKSLKAKSKIGNKSCGSNSLNVRKDKGGPQAHWKQRKKNKHVFKVNKESSSNEEVGRLKSTEKGKEKNIVSPKHDNKSHQPKKKSQQNKEKSDDGIEKSHHDERKEEKLGGLIFMCNAKTKPDCFCYRVMGMTTSKKDIVMTVKPGLKLFLYDFDLKLLYGIYKASSSGGMKLEPRAFGGAFPVQVRFSIQKDCLPLPEAVFKKAIKENYNEKNKFKTELTVKQTRKLENLFRPAEAQSTVLPVCSQPVTRVGDREVYERPKGTWPHYPKVTLASYPYTNADSGSYHLLSRERNHQRIPSRNVTTIPREDIPREFYLSEKDYRAYGLQGERSNLVTPSHITPTLETYQRDYGKEHLLRQPGHIYMGTFSAQRETVPADPLYLKEYQSYGLGGRYELPSTVRTATATSATALVSYLKDPYYASNYGASSVEPYVPTLRREEAPSGSYSVGGTHSIETAHLARTENYQGGSLYSTIAANAFYNQTQRYQAVQPEGAPIQTQHYLPVQPKASPIQTQHYQAVLPPNQTQHYLPVQPEAAPVPVSSRYSFAGLSFPYQ